MLGIILMTDLVVRDGVNTENCPAVQAVVSVIIAHNQYTVRKTNDSR